MKELAVNQTVMSPAVWQSRLQDYLQEPGESLRLPLRHSVPDARQLPPKVADAAPTHLTAVEPAHRSEAQSAIGIETVAGGDVWRAAVEREYTAYWDERTDAARVAVAAFRASKLEPHQQRKPLLRGAFSVEGEACRAGCSGPTQCRSFEAITAGQLYAAGNRSGKKRSGTSSASTWRWSVTVCQWSMPPLGKHCPYGGFTSHLYHSAEHRDSQHSAAPFADVASDTVGSVGDGSNNGWNIHCCQVLRECDDMLTNRINLEAGYEDMPRLETNVSWSRTRLEKLRPAIRVRLSVDTFSVRNSSKRWSTTSNRTLQRRSLTGLLRLSRQQKNNGMYVGRYG